MKDIYQEFYISKFNSIDNNEDLDLSFIPPMQRRRLSMLDKYTVHTIKKCFSDEVENIVYSSQNGEIERLLKIINQYTVDGEVSPNTFAGSVHNYPAGFFLLSEGCSIPYTALSAGKDSLSAGMLSAVVSEHKNVIYCFSDVYGERVVSFALNISKNPSSSSKKYRMHPCANNSSNDNFDEYVRLFREEITKLSTPMFEIERIG